MTSLIAALLNVKPAKPYMQHLRKKHGLLYELVKPTLDYGRNFGASEEIA